MDRIIDISNDGQFIHKDRGFLVVASNEGELGRVPLDEIYALIVHAHGTTYSNSLFIELANQGAITVLCAANHFPTAYVLPIEGNTLQSARIKNQINATEPRRKQLWKDVVISKIKMQIACLQAFGKNSARLEQLAKRVRSGDPQNLEAQAARFYWQELMGKDFRRDRYQEGINSLLNYGYTVLRAAVARSIIAAGLHPSIGLHHKSARNSFALADDLMEPFRPLVDSCVMGLMMSGIEDLIPDAKQELAKLITLDLDLDTKRSPLSSVLNQLCTSLNRAYEDPKAKLIWPSPPNPLEFRQLGHVENQVLA